MFVFLGCMEVQDEKKDEALKKENAIGITITSHRDLDKQLVYEIKIVSYVKSKVQKSFIFSDTLPNIGKDTIKIEDYDGNEKDTIIDKPYDIFFSSKNLR